MPELEDELLLVPVVVVNVGTVEALDHFGGAGAGFDDPRMPRAMRARPSR